MASFHDLRPARTAVLAPNRGRSSMRQTAGLGVLACFLAAAAMINVQARQQAEPGAVRPVLAAALGAPNPHAPFARRLARNVRTRIDGTGFDVAAPKTLVALLYEGGRDVTPAGLKWSLGHDRKGWLLELRLDDSELPLPYVIDPAIAIHTYASMANNGAGSASLKIYKPIGTAPNDLLLTM